MKLNAPIKMCLTVFTVLFLALVAFSAEVKNSNEIENVSKILNDRTLGSAGQPNPLLSPAQSLETTKSTVERIRSVNLSLINELDLVLSAFKSAPEDQKTTAVRAALEKIDAQLVASEGANIVFVDSNPSAAAARTVLMIPKKSNSITAKDVLDTLTSYKRSAKQNDHVYEYTDAQNLTTGAIQYRQGSETSWKKPEAAAALELSRDTVLKKCRQLLGWKCVTSLYHADSFLPGADQIKTLFISIYDLEKNRDHADFSNDKRSQNQITGSTALYIVKESPDWILFYGVDSQWNNGKLSFQKAIQTEFVKDFLKFKERLSLDLNIPIEQLKSF